MSEACIRFDVAAGVGTIVVSNPARYNAMTLRMWKQMTDAVTELQNEAAVRVLVVTGEGEKSFVSGADISEFGQKRSGAAAVAEYDQAVAAAQQALATCRKPTVARIQGICMGGGIGIALACDLRFASSQALFRMPAARLGLGYAFDGMQRLVQVLGVACTLDLFYTARLIDAAEARRIGLVNDSFDAGAYDDEVKSRVALIATNAPLSVGAAKMAALAALRAPSPPERDAIDAMVRHCFESRDYAEGQAAFAERRPPRFEGR